MDMIKLHHDFTIVPEPEGQEPLTCAHAGTERLRSLLRLGLEAINVPNEFRANHYGSRRTFGRRGFCSFCLDQCQFPGVQPVPGTIWTMIHLHSPFGAKVMAEQFYPGAPRALSFPGWIHLNGLVPLDLEQLPRTEFALDPLKFEGIKPNATASPLAHIQKQTTELNLNQFVVAGRTFHDIKSNSRAKL